MGIVLETLQIYKSEDLQRRNECNQRKVWIKDEEPCDRSSGAVQAAGWTPLIGAGSIIRQSRLTPQESQSIALETTGDACKACEHEGEIPYQIGK